MIIRFLYIYLYSAMIPIYNNTYMYHYIINTQHRRLSPWSPLRMYQILPGTISVRCMFNTYSRLQSMVLVLAPPMVHYECVCSRAAIKDCFHYLSIYFHFSWMTWMIKIVADRSTCWLIVLSLHVFNGCVTCPIIVLSNIFIFSYQCCKHYSSCDAPQWFQVSC